MSLACAEATRDREARAAAAAQSADYGQSRGHSQPACGASLSTASLDIARIARQESKYPQQRSSSLGQLMPSPRAIPSSGMLLSCAALLLALPGCGGATYDALVNYRLDQMRGECAVSHLVPAQHAARHDYQNPGADRFFEILYRREQSSRRRRRKRRRQDQSRSPAAPVLGIAGPEDLLRRPVVDAAKGKMPFYCYLAVDSREAGRRGQAWPKNCRPSSRRPSRTRPTSGKASTRDSPTDKALHLEENSRHRRPIIPCRLQKRRTCRHCRASSNCGSMTSRTTSS